MWESTALGSGRRRGQCDAAAADGLLLDDGIKAFAHGLHKDRHGVPAWEVLCVGLVWRAPVSRWGMDGFRCWRLAWAVCMYRIGCRECRPSIDRSADLVPRKGPSCLRTADVELVAASESRDVWWFRAGGMKDSAVGGEGTFYCTVFIAGPGGGPCVAEPRSPCVVAANGSSSPFPPPLPEAAVTPAMRDWHLQ
jgi:hypothetical protein